MEKKEEILKLQANICKMLSNPTRLRILEELCDDEKTVGELVSAIGIRQANVSQHLSELRKRRLVRARREGVNVYYEIAYPKIIKACEMIREILFEQLSKNRELMEE